MTDVSSDDLAICLYTLRDTPVPHLTQHVRGTSLTPPGVPMILASYPVARTWPGLPHD